MRKMSCVTWYLKAEFSGNLSLENIRKKYKQNIQNSKENRDWGKMKIPFEKLSFKGWKGSSQKNIYWSSWIPTFCSQYLYRWAHMAACNIPWYLISSSDLRGYLRHLHLYTHTHLKIYVWNDYPSKLKKKLT